MVYLAVSYSIWLQAVSSIETASNGRVSGVLLESGQVVRAKVVLSNATPEVTFTHLMHKVGGLATSLMSLHLVATKY